MKWIVFLLAAVLLSACCSTRESVTTATTTVVRDSIVHAVSPSIDEELYLSVDTDTLKQASRVAHGDTVIIIRYFPKEGKMSAKVKPDTVEIPVAVSNTNTNTSTTIEKISFWEYIKVGAIGFVCGCILCVVAAFILKSRGIL